MATINAEEEGETRNSRLQVFLSSLFSSLGGVFSSNGQENQDLEMASRAVVVVPHQLQRGTNVLSLSSSLIGSFGHLCLL